MILTPLPRMGPGVVARPRIQALLERTCDRPLRLLTAPVGGGKTCAIAQYLRTLRGNAAYLALKRDETPDRLRERIGEALCLAYVPASFPALLAALATFAPLTLAIDDCERATSETLEELAGIVDEAPEGVSLLYATRSPGGIDRGRLFARGLVTRVDGATLGFDGIELEAVARALNLRFEPADLANVASETEGWPLAAAWVARAAAESGTSLAGAFERWRADEAANVAAFVADTLDEARLPERNAALRALTGRGDGSGALAELKARGLFVPDVEDAARPYRALARIDLRRAEDARSEPVPILVIQMFGRFDAKIGGTPVAWMRRREAQLFKYLSLKPEGAATRAELCELFWPGASHHLATQSLRTACSNVRKAIAKIVGYANVERYFRTSPGEIAVVLDRAAIDVRRFNAHVHDGDRDAEAGRGQEAYAHYRAAEELYVGELLAGDYPEPWYAPRAEMYRSLFGGVLLRLADHYRDRGDLPAAARYAERARTQVRLMPLVAPSPANLLTS